MYELLTLHASFINSMDKKATSELTPFPHDTACIVFLVAKSFDEL